MYKKVLYNIKKIKQMWRTGGAIFEPKTLSMYLKQNNKKSKKKNVTQPGLEPTTSWLKNPALLSTRLHYYRNFKIGGRKLQHSNSNY